MKSASASTTSVCPATSMCKASRRVLAERMYDLRVGANERHLDVLVIALEWSTRASGPCHRRCARRHRGGSTRPCARRGDAHSSALRVVSIR
jgi:hypothetical protein